ncbi:MAG: hypothetical protein IS860_10180 [Nitrosopumilus sp.]|nr:hypothetical protein [Nitrosopumilus sp.]
MVHKAGPERTPLSIKSRLIIIAIMFVIINLVFYFGFDFSDESNESENSIELDGTNQPSNEKSIDLNEGLGISISP